MYKCSPFGEEVDLDDPKTYEHLPQTTEELRTKIFSEFGFAYVYMNYWHPDWFLLLNF